MFCCWARSFWAALSWPAGIPDPLEPVFILPEILDPKNWYGGAVHWGNKERTVIHMDAYPNNSVSRNTELAITRDQNLQVNWLVQGKYIFTLWAIPPIIGEFKDAGAPIAYVFPKEGTYLSRDGGGVVLANRAPHPNAAKIFINWLMSKEGLTLMAKIYGAQSARIDVPAEGIDPANIRQPGVKYFTEADTKEWKARDPQYIAAALEIFGSLLK